METWPHGRHVRALDAEAPRPGPEYERCVFDSEWTRAEVLGVPVCWPCYREMGVLVGPAIRSRLHVLTQPSEAPALGDGGSN